ncbi:hypothetical protein ACLOJK_011451 [Asimina triloba]
MDSFLRFSEKVDHYSFFTPWGGYKNQQSHASDQDHTSPAPFSFFSRQFDYYKKLREEGQFHNNVHLLFVQAKEWPAAKKILEFDRGLDEHLADSYYTVGQ